uniref:Uncharacterized protein n=1 Tax=Meloidogyne javanica TaxID=6303 RepID=A0A915N092_MELJA
INGICEELLCTMLHLNENYPQLFEKVLQMCYIKDELVGSRCFRSLALLFSQRQFLDINLSPLNLSSILDEHNKNVSYFSISQTCISQQLAKQYSQLTMPIFSVFSGRGEGEFLAWMKSWEAKKISSYILEACGEEFVSLLVNNLENVGKPFKHFLCRSEMPPFYRWENETKKEENFENKIEEINNNEEINDEFCEEKNINNQETTTPTLNSLLKIIPKQLPMPPYGGNYSRLSLLFQPQNNNNGCLLSR